MIAKLAVVVVAALGTSGSPVLRRDESREMNPPIAKVQPRERRPSRTEHARAGAVGESSSSTWDGDLFLNDTQRVHAQEVREDLGVRRPSVPTPVPAIGKLCDTALGCVPQLVFLDDDVIHLEAAASHPTIRPGKVYVPAWTTAKKCRVYELDISQPTITKRIVIEELQLLKPDSQNGHEFKPFGARVANDGILFITELPNGWTVGVDVATGETVTQVRTCQPNDFDLIQNADGSEITLLAGGGYRFERYWGHNGNGQCDWTDTSLYGNIIKVPLKRGGAYLCGKPALADGGHSDGCSWDNYDEYEKNTENGGNSRWPVLGQGSQRGGASLNGPLAGLAVAADGQIWTAHLNSIVKTDPNSGEATDDIRAANWYSEFNSEYSLTHIFGAVDNTRMLSDGTSMLTAIYEAFISSSNTVSLGESYGVPGGAATPADRKLRTKFAHIVATSFCTDRWEAGMDWAEVAQISKIFKFDPSGLEMPESYCQKYDPDRCDADSCVEYEVDMPCFSGRVTHVEPVYPTDAIVAVNYQSKAVLVMQHAGLSRLECASWVPLPA